MQSKYVCRKVVLSGSGSEDPAPQETKTNIRTDVNAFRPAATLRSGVKMHAKGACTQSRHWFSKVWFPNMSINRHYQARATKETAAAAIFVVAKDCDSGSSCGAAKQRWHSVVARSIPSRGSHADFAKSGDRGSSCNHRGVISRARFLDAAHHALEHRVLETRNRADFERGPPKAFSLNFGVSDSSLLPEKGIKSLETR